MNDLLIQSCELYHAYLSNHHKGIQIFNLVSYEISHDSFTLLLNLNNKIFSLDSVIIENNELYLSLDDERIKKRIYYENLKKLELQIDASIFFNLKEGLENKTLKIYSDLKFLINNLKSFFTEFQITLPTFNPKNKIQNISTLNKSQYHALCGILNSSLSYVWGPPGTGKTQYVLFEAVSYFLKLNQKICVIAPTNNALEQILMTLIKRFDLLKISRNNILRLGIPTKNFFNTFMEVCEPSIIQQQNHNTLFNDYLNPKTRYQEAKIFGMTIDGFIRKYPNLDIQFAHIFLDESAFTPLIKALALCINNTPITLLGDHKQISPICEIDQKNITKELQSLKLWNFSALYLENFFTNKTFLESNHHTLSFKKTCLYTLDSTHRYGDNLAGILDKHIYKIGLKGTEYPTEIFFIDSPHSSQDRQLLSLPEAHNAYRVYQELKNEDLAIITPFNAQRNYLIQKGVASQNIVTIHSSQGREFDIVIFSPVCLHYFFTDSNYQRALYTLNVAISRLRKCLILVCDYYFWLNKEEQLLSKILRQAKPYNFKL